MGGAIPERFTLRDIAYELAFVGPAHPVTRPSIRRKTLRMRTLIPVSVVGLVMLCGVVGVKADSPNILFILSDDVGVGDLGVTGQLARAAQGLPAISTPNIDSIANNGLRFNSVYATAPMCEPTRTAFLTGFHQGHAVNDRNDTAKWIRNGDEDKTYGQVVQEAGYATGYFGKMHASGVMGWRSTIEDVNSLPTAKGFEDVMLTDGYRGNDQWEDDGLGGMVNLGNPTGIYNQQTVGDRAVSMIQAKAAANEPFMITTSFYGVHSDVNQVPEPHDYSSESWSEAEKDYAATLTYLDGQVGRMLAALDDPNDDGDNADSILDNTIIIFGSDNGNQNVDGHSPNFFDSTLDLRGVKFNVYEGGIRSPFFVQWGDQIKPGAVNEPGDVNDTFIGTFADLLPTFAEVAGADVPLGIDGRSMLSDLTGEGPSDRPDYFVWGTNVARAGGSRGWAIRMGDWKLVKRMGGGAFELYNLATDESETTNLVSSRPDIKVALETIALAEGAQDMGETNGSGGGNTYFVQYKDWSPAGGSDDFNAAANWSGGTPSQNNDGSGLPADNYATGPANNWLATVVNDGGGGGPFAPGDDVVNVTDDAEVLALEVRGVANKMTVNIERHHELAARNEFRIGANGRVNLDDATLNTMRTVDVRDGGELTGHGTVTGNQDIIAGIAEFADQGLLEPHVVNSGLVAPGRPDDLPAAPDPGPTPTETVIDIDNGDFELPVYEGPPGIASNTVIGWNEESASHSSIDDQVGNLAPSDFTQTGRLHDNTGAAINQNLGYNWSLGETLTLSFGAWEAGWRIGDVGDAFVVELRQADGTVLWDSGTLNVDDTLAGTTGNVTLGPANDTFVLAIDTDTFTAGTPGSELNLRFRHAGGVTWFDDLSLVSDLVVVLPNVDLDSTGVLTIEGDYTQTTEGELAIQLAGTDQSDPLDVQHDQLVVTDAVELAGALSLSTDDGFTPALGDEFVIITGDTLTGNFDNAQVSGAAIDASTSLAVLYEDGPDGDALTDRVRLVATYNGDANGDGEVSLVDLNALGANFGSVNATWQSGDFNYDGEVSLLDLNALGANFGQSVASATPAVPEPAGLFYVWFGAIFLLRQRSRAMVKHAIDA